MLLIAVLDLIPFGPRINATGLDSGCLMSCQLRWHWCLVRLQEYLQVVEYLHPQ